ncbi:response regulator transcription factor [Burkholderia stagnalis]|uniref:response regulator transcription factor n=1 Tax=Burkholderia stagnalis TaxID=1503054 RepID=UPI0013E01512|nr:response regulator transcription factor [Burkholderia stagnalis]
MNTTTPHSSQPIRVIVADDHPVVLMGIRKVLEVETNIDLIATVGSLDELRTVLEVHACDVLVCDYAFDDDIAHDGMRLIARLKRTYPGVRIVMLTVHDDLTLVRRLLAAGVSGFISKSSSALMSLALAIRTVHQGDLYIDPKVAHMLMSEHIKSISNRSTPRKTTLSNREYEAVRLISLGMTISEIARQTCRSVKTVSTQKASAMKKLGVHNDVELVIAFRGLAEEDAT